MKSIEELLKPRYKVIADYPGNENEVGSIISWRGHRAMYADMFPHLFKRLEWWEERQESEMPKYVSYVSLTKRENIYGDAKTSDDNFSKARVFVQFGGIEKIRSFYGNTVLPATEEEYQAFIQLKSANSL